MSTPRVLTSTRGLSRPEWLEWRRRGLGGSDAAAALGLSPWTTRYALWLDKVGLAADGEPSEAMRLGTRLEQVICDEFQERTGYTVRRTHAIWQHPDHPWMLASPDRIIGIGGASRALNSDGPVRHGRGVLEAKSAHSFASDEWEDEVPDHYMLQLQHTLAVTGLAWGAFAVLLGGNRFRWFHVDRDDDLTASLVEAEGRFWRDHVVAGVAPDVAGADSALLSRRHPRAAAGAAVDLPAAAGRWIVMRDLCAANEAAGRTDKQEYEAKLKEALGDCEVGLLDGETVVTWKQVSASRVDLPKLRENYPDAAEDCSVESISRRLHVPKPKKEPKNA